MRLHIVCPLPRDYVIIVKNCALVDEGAPSALLWTPGDDQFVQLLKIPDKALGSIARFYPSVEQRRLN